MNKFNNVEISYSDKSNQDLNRAYILFKSISNPYISKILTKILKISFWLRLPISPLIKATVYKQFCGGISIKNSQKTIDKLWKSRIGTILDFSAEGMESEKDFNRVMNETISSINKSKTEKKIPFSVFKLTGICQFSLLEKLSNKGKLTDEDKINNEKFMIRIENICQTAFDMKVPIFIDAEESWIQDSIDEIVTEMMLKFNKNEAWIFNTIQLYRHDRINYLEKTIIHAKQEKYFVGIKIVRGAYHEKEIERSNKKGYKCPVHIKKNDTDLDYNKALIMCIKNIDIISLCAGTHNEESSEKLIRLLEEYNIPKNDKRVYFSQLLGMSDNISYNLAKDGFNVAKYVPYGPVKDVIPYLLRRAEENTSISGQMGRELSNIIKEKNRRKNL